jgi:uncharacterized protein DUF6415
MSPAVKFAAGQARELVANAQRWRNGILPPHTELDEMTEQLRLLLDILLTDAESRAAALLEDSPTRQTLADVVAAARAVIADGPGPGLRSATNHARALADVADRLLRDQEGTDQ